MATGAIIGGFIGDRVAGRGGRVVGIALGAVIGGVIGYEIGHSLNPTDRREFRSWMAAGLNKSRPDEQLSWTNASKSVTASTKVAVPRSEERQVLITRPPSVEPPPAMELVGEPHSARSEVVVSAGPRQGAKSLGKLKAGQTVLVMGRVKNTNWLMIGSENRVLGYIPAESVGADDGMTWPRSLDRENTASATADASSRLVTEPAKVTTTCRAVSYSLKNSDGHALEDVSMDACKVISGGWAYKG